MIISIDIGNGFIKALNSKNNYLHFQNIGDIITKQ